MKLHKFFQNRLCYLENATNGFEKIELSIYYKGYSQSYFLNYFITQYL